jgi:hypothetical protein
MCVPKAPKQRKAPPPPKPGLEAAEIVEVEEVNQEDDLKRKASGLDQLRIDLTAPSSSLPKGGAALQIGR